MTLCRIAVLTMPFMLLGCSKSEGVSEGSKPVRATPTKPTIPVAPPRSDVKKPTPTPTPTPTPKPTPESTPESTPAATPSPKVDLTAARALFKIRCSPCHGMSGKGDGPAAKALKPKPRNYTDSVWQAKVTDKQIEDIIVRGGVAVGKAATMPPATDLKSKPKMVTALRQLIRSFAKKK